MLSSWFSSFGPQIHSYCVPLISMFRHCLHILLHWSYLFETETFSCLLDLASTLRFMGEHLLCSIYIICCWLSYSFYCWGKNISLRILCIFFLPYILFPSNSLVFCLFVYKEFIFSPIAFLTNICLLYFRCYWWNYSI